VNVFFSQTFINGLVSKIIIHYKQRIQTPKTYKANMKCRNRKNNSYSKFTNPHNTLYLHWNC